MNLDDDSGAGRRRIHLREINGDSDAPLETVGQDLRAARLRRGDDLATVSRSLKIRKDHLTAVEEDNFEDLPGKTYAIGFVRSYAGYLGLDVTQTVERYKQELAGRHDDQMPTAHVVHNDDNRLPQGWRIVAGVVGLALIYGVWHLLSAGTASQPVPPAPNLNPPRPQVVAAAPPPAPAAPDSAVPPPAVDAVNPVPPSASPSTSMTAVPSPAISSSASPAVPAVATPQPAQPSRGQVYGRSNGAARVVLRARGDTHILVRGRDGMVYINRALKAGDSYQLPNIVGLSLATTNAGAVELDLDGLAMGRAGAELQTAGGIRLDPQEIVDRFNKSPG